MVDQRYRGAVVAGLLWCTCLVATTASGGLQERAEELLAQSGRPRSADHMDSLAAALSTVADSLAPGDPAMAARALESAGILRFRLAQVPTANEYWARGLELARAAGDSSRQASLLNATGIGLANSGRMAEAERVFEELVHMRRALGDRRGEGVTLTNLARLQMQLFHLPEADRTLERALAVNREVGNDRAVATGYITRSQILLELLEPEAALAMVDSAVAMARRGDMPDVLAAALVDRGRARRFVEGPAAALDDLEEGLARLRELDDQLVADQALRERAECLIELGRTGEAIADLEGIIGRLEQNGDEHGALLARPIVGFALQQAGRPAEAAAHLEETITRLEHFRGTLEDEGQLIGSFRVAGIAYTDLAMCRLELGDPEGAWAAEEAGRASRLRHALAGGDSLAAEPPSLARVQSALRDLDAQLLHLGPVTGGRRPVFVVRPDTLVGLVLTDHEELLDDLRTTARLLSGGAADSLAAPAMGRLAAAVLHPVEERLDAGRSRLLLSLPRALSDLPYEELPGRGGRPADRWSTSHVPSAASLLLLMQREGATGPVLALADPRLSPGEGPTALAPRFRGPAGQPLPHARAEARAVAAGGGIMVAGEEASREQLRGHGPASALHFATHAVVDPVHPDASALLLAGTGQAATLSAAEVETLALRADLVTLSGCRTGDGLPVLGEGTLGLSRAFLLAGARSVVVSRWDVEDEAARRFMEEFYGALRGGMERDHALASARAALVREGRPARDTAAFVLAGVPSGTVAGLGGEGPLLRPVWLVVLLGLTAGLLLVRRRRRATG